MTHVVGQRMREGAPEADGATYWTICQDPIVAYHLPQLPNAVTLMTSRVTFPVSAQLGELVPDLLDHGGQVVRNLVEAIESLVVCVRDGM